MKDFLKENLVLVSGIALPLLLTLIFFASTQIGKVIEDPPQYSVVFATNYHKGSNNPYLFKVNNSKGLEIYYNPPKESENGHYHRNWSEPELYVFNPLKNNTTRITLPEIDQSKEQTLIIPDFNNKKLSRAHESPDGYKFEYSYRSNSNLMTEIFGGGSRYRNHNQLVNNTNRVNVKGVDRYVNGTFVAWVIE